MPTAWGVNETRRDLPGWIRWPIDNRTTGPACNDHKVQECLLKAALRDWLQAWAVRREPLLDEAITMLEA